MPQNHDIEAALKYHNATKHSYASVRANPHFLDFANQPLPFKIYPTLEPSRLPEEVRQTGVAALSAIAESVPAQTNASPDLNAIAQLLYLSAGITRQRKYSAAKYIFAPPLVLERCTKSSFIWFAANSAIFRLALITSPLPSSACANCVPETVAACWSKPRTANRLSLMLR